MRLQRQMASSSSSPPLMTEKVKNRGFRFRRLFHFKLFQSTEISYFASFLHLCWKRSVKNMLPFTATQEINFCGLFCLLLFAHDKSLQKVWVPLRKCPFGYCSPRGTLHCRLTYFGGNLAYTSIFKHSFAVNQHRHFGGIAFNSPSKSSSRKTYLL